MKEGIELPKKEYLIDGYKEPLKPVENGFGYYGVKTESRDGKYIQSHLDGRFYGAITGKYVKKFGFKNLKEYKIHFGFSNKQAMVSRKLSETISRNSIERMKNPALLRQMKRNLRKYGHRGRQSRPSLYRRNLNGVCPDQLVDKLIKLREKLGKIPSRRDWANEYGSSGRGYILKDYGSFKNFVKSMGWESVSDSWDRKFSKEAVITSVKRYYEIEKRSPTQKDFVNGTHGLSGTHHIYKYWGSLNALRQDARVPLYISMKKLRSGKVEIYMDVELNA